MTKSAQRQIVAKGALAGFWRAVDPAEKRLERKRPNDPGRDKKPKMNKTVVRQFVGQPEDQSDIEGHDRKGRKDQHQLFLAGMKHFSVFANLAGTLTALARKVDGKSGIGCQIPRH